MNRIDLEGQVAVITGAAQGIGFACAKRFIASGAKVALWDKDAVMLGQALETLGAGSKAFGKVVDVTDPASIRAGLEAVNDAYSNVTIMVNNAGIAGPSLKTWEYSDADWKAVIDLDLTGVFYGCRAVIGQMREAGYGRIVNVASIAGKEGNPNACAYSAAKAGVIALTKSLAKEVADLDIAVNCITPAAARTRIFDQMSQAHIDYMLSKIPRGRFVQVDEIANMMAWLVSAENSFTTGAAFDLSGGRASY
ncbi:MAG: SDR family oxidoreductase [Gammaproteobacteria bacterium]|nr:SDR family oxidoreductase [Gammaproteobacteria bacterium]